MQSSVDPDQTTPSGSTLFAIPLSILTFVLLNKLMPLPFLIFSQSNYFDPDFLSKFTYSQTCWIGHLFKSAICVKAPALNIPYHFPYNFVLYKSATF